MIVISHVGKAKLVVYHTRIYFISDKFSKINQNRTQSTVWNKKYLPKMIIIYNQVKQIASSQMKFYLPVVVNFYKSTLAAPNSGVITWII